jgi:hypothetical protein
MKSALAMLLLAGAWGLAGSGPGTGGVQDKGRFVAVEVWVDSEGSALAAYQVELSARQPMRVVGVENGEHPAFAGDPYFDREAVDHGRADRLILAAFSLKHPDQLPREATRVATVMTHVEAVAGADPGFDIQLEAAAGVDAQPIDANVSLRVTER